MLLAAPADAPSNPRGSIHARTHSQCSARTSPCVRRSLGPRADPLQQPRRPTSEDGDARRPRRRPRRQRVDDGVGLAGAHRPPPQQPAERRIVTIGGPTARTSQRRLRQRWRRASATTDLREPPPPAARQAQAGDLDAGAGDAGQRPGRQLVDVVEDLLLVAREGVALAAAPVGEQDDLVLGVLDAQPASGDEVEQRGHGRRRRDDEAVRQQAGDGRRLGAELGRRASTRPAAAVGCAIAGPQQQHERGQQQQDRPPQRPGVGSREEPEQRDHPSAADSAASRRHHGTSSPASRCHASTVGRCGRRR